MKEERGWVWHPCRRTFLKASGTALLLTQLPSCGKDESTSPSPATSSPTEPARGKAFPDKGHYRHHPERGLHAWHGLHDHAKAVIDEQSMTASFESDLGHEAGSIRDLVHDSRMSRKIGLAMPADWSHTIEVSSQLTGMNASSVHPDPFFFPT